MDSHQAAKEAECTIHSLAMNRNVHTKQSAILFMVFRITAYSNVLSVVLSNYEDTLTLKLKLQKHVKNLKLVTHQHQ